LSARKAVVLAAIAIAAGLYGWWRYAPDTLPGFARNTLPRSPESNPPLYRWRDAEGRWQITDVPPADRPYETVVVDPRTNVVPAYGTKPEDD